MVVGIRLARRTSQLGLAAILLLAAPLAFADPAPVNDAGAAGVEAAVSNAYAKLNVVPPTIELTWQKGLRARQAIMSDDFATAGQIIDEVKSNSRLDGWDDSPFPRLLDGIAGSSDPGLATHLDAWVAQNPNDPIPLLVRARYYRDLGSRRRGSNVAALTQPANLAAFVDDMTKALGDVDASIRLDDQNPYSFYLKVSILRRKGISQAMADAFHEAIAKYPDYYQVYDLLLTTLQPKWGGSVASMRAFVDQYAGGAPDQSPLRLLYVSLYRDLFNTASTSCVRYWRDQDKMTNCIASDMQTLITPDLEEHVLAALKLYDHSDHYEFGIVVGGIISDMLDTAGGPPYAGGILELAATAMHSDTQLQEKDPGHNDYAVDRAVANSWFQTGNYDNAIAKDQEALADAEATTFSDEVQKDQALASIYERIGTIYSAERDFVDAIANEKAASTLAGETGDEHVPCYAYYQLKDYQAAIALCTKAVDQTGNMFARYWRGESYKALGQTDDALADLTIMADSEEDFRVSAAIDMSMIYFNRSDIQNALGVLNKYNYLYNDNLTSRQDIAVSYNNRCYARMQLGDLKEALSDCTLSLEYGSIPDAYSKQQKLLALLAAHTSSQ